MVYPLHQPIFADDRAALLAASEPGVGLCTIVGIDGSFSRRLGAQLAIDSRGQITGSLADGCLERQLVSEMKAARDAGMQRVRRFGSGSDIIDFRLPCGSGIDILIDPAPDHDQCRQAAARLHARKTASLPLPTDGGLLQERCYIPSLRMLLFGEGPELAALLALASATGVATEAFKADGAALSLGQAPEGVEVDQWTTIILLFHDHEWEREILKWALDTPAFLIGAQGGAEARRIRFEELEAAGVSAGHLERIISPIGLIPRTREPAVLALSILAQAVGEYEALHPHA